MFFAEPHSALPRANNARVSSMVVRRPKILGYISGSYYVDGRTITSAIPPLAGSKAVEARA